MNFALTSKKSFALLTLFFVVVSLFAPFAQARAQATGAQAVYTTLLKDSTINNGVPNAEKTQMSLWVRVKTSGKTMNDGIGWLELLFPPAFYANLLLKPHSSETQADFMLVYDIPNLGSSNFSDSQFLARMQDVTPGTSNPLDRYIDFSGQINSRSPNQQIALTNIPAQMDPAAKLEKDHTYKLTAYYKADCGSDCAGETIDASKLSNGELDSNDKNYYAFATKTFTFNDAEIQNTIEQQSSGSFTEESNASTNLPECGIWPLINVVGCFANIVYYVLFVPTSFIFSLAGQLFDFSMEYTLDSASYGKTSDGSSFVEKGWTITRDIANIFFIIILMYLAICTILDLGNVDAKKIIPVLVVVALILNFSLFFTRVVIDAGNILGTIFYNGIGTDKVDTSKSPWLSGEGKNISVAIVAKFNPQELFKASKSLELNTPGGVTDAKLSSQWPLSFTIITLIMSVINLIGAYIFFVIAFLFIGRVIALWLLMIFAPIAFLTYAMPSNFQSKFGDLTHGNWWSTLLSQTFLVPVFLFFLYLIIMFLNTDFFSAAIQAGSTTTQKIIGVIVPLLLIVFLLNKAKDIATKMAGEMGAKMAGVTNFVGGAALGLATGGAGLALRGTVGRLGSSIAQSESLKNAASQTGVRGFMARRALNVARGASNATYDARNVEVAGKNLAGATGFKTGKVKSQGFERDLQARQAREQSYAQSLRTGVREERQLNEHRNQLAYMQSIGVNNVDPRTGQQVSAALIAGLQANVAAEQAIVNQINSMRRENYARVAEQGTGFDYLINRTTAPFDASGRGRVSAYDEQAAQRIRGGQGPGVNANNSNAVNAALAGAVNNLINQMQQQNNQQNPPAAACWVAEEIYGVNAQLTHLARFWASTQDSIFNKIYRKYGKLWAKIIHDNTWLLPFVKPIWDSMARKGALLFEKYQHNPNLIPEKFHYLANRIVK